jgi:hypothetical protein
MTPRANWDAHFARIIRVTVAQIKKKESKNGSTRQT